MTVAKRPDEERNRVWSKALIVFMTILAFGFTQEAAAHGKCNHHHGPAKKCVKIKRVKHKKNCHHRAHHRWVEGHYAHRNGVRIWVPGVWIRL